MKTHRLLPVSVGSAPADPYAAAFFGGSLVNCRFAPQWRQTPLAISASTIRTTQWWTHPRRVRVVLFDRVFALVI